MTQFPIAEVSKGTMQVGRIQPRCQADRYGTMRRGKKWWVSRWKGWAESVQKRLAVI